MTKALQRRDKKPTVYGFACGLKYSYEVNDDNRVTIYMEHGSYQIVGFEGGKHFRYSHMFNKDAWETFRCIKARLAYAKALDYMQSV
jgi:hypothetical protein